jgi:spore maturation protein A
MINWIWIGLIAFGVIFGAINGKMDEVTKAIFSYAKTAVEISIGLVGVMALWLGLMKIAEEAGLVRALGRAVRPFMTWIFPDVPKDHPAMGAMVANIAANIMGLGNSATPLGLKAMQDLQDLNQEKQTATNAMVMFIVLNATAVTLIPATILALRKDAVNPTSILLPTIIVTIFNTVVGVIASRMLERFFKPNNK